MVVNIVLSEEFKRNAKKLAKKYPSFVDDLVVLKQELTASPFQGVDLGNGARKVRMSITSKGKGKSGGARVITYSINQQSDNLITLTLLTIYDKSEISNLKENFVNWLIQQVTASDL